MALKIRKPDENRYVKALIFGPAGQGKTHFLGTAQSDERTSPMLLLDFEGGHETLSGLDIDIAEIRSWEDYNEAYELLSSPDCKYRSVGIDSISETHVWALLERVRKLGPSRREPDLIEQGDYGVASTQLRRLLREFRDLPMHVFYVASSKQEDERGVGMVAKPAMAGQMSNDVLGLMSVAGYLALTEDEEGETQRVLLLQNYPKFRTKIRMPWEVQAPDELEDPTVSRLLDVLGVGDYVRVEPEEPDEEELEDETEEEEDPEDELKSYDDMSVKELRAEAKERGLKSTGTGSQLKERLREADAMEDAAPASGGTE